MARLWRATRVHRVGIAEQAGTHEVRRGPISFRRGVRVQLQDESRRRVPEGRCCAVRKSTPAATHDVAAA